MLNQSARFPLGGETIEDATLELRKLGTTRLSAQLFWHTNLSADSDHHLPRSSSKHKLWWAVPLGSHATVHCLLQNDAETLGTQPGSDGSSITKAGK